MRVLVCRARAEGEATARKLVAAGHEPILTPVSEIVALPCVAPMESFDALLMTSRHAVAGIPERETRPLKVLPVYAVGARTAAAARAAGFPDVRVGAGDAAALVDLLRLTLRAPAKLLYLAGRVRKPDLPAALAADGYAVTICETYDARPAPPWSAGVIERLQAGQIDACLHFSRRSADLAIAASRQGGAEPAFLALHHICISDDAAAPLKQCGTSACVVAAHPDEAGLLEALGRFAT